MGRFAGPMKRFAASMSVFAGYRRWARALWAALQDVGRDLRPLGTGLRALWTDLRGVGRDLRPLGKLDGGLRTEL